MPFATRAPVGLVAALLLLRLFDETAAFLPAGAFESFRHDLGLSYAGASAVLAAAAPGAIAGNVFAIAADYRSRRVIAAGGTFAFAAALMAFAFGHSFAALAGSSFVMGAASTAMVDAGELALIDLAGDDLPAALARTNLFGALGDLLGPAALIVTAALGWSWRVPFVAAAVALAAYGVWLARLPLPAPVRDPGDQVRPRHAMRAVVGDRRVWFYAAAAALLGPLDEPLLAVLIAFGEHRRGLPAPAAVAIAMCSIAGSLVGYTHAARTNTTSRAVLVASASVMAATTAVLVVAPWPLALAFGAAGFGYAMARFWNALHARILRVRPRQAGTVKAVVTTVEFSAFGLPILYGAIADGHGIAAGLACYAVTAGALAALMTRAPADDVANDYASNERAI